LIDGQTFKDIYSFTGQRSSAFPDHVLPVQGRDGLMYATTTGQGGTNYGTIFSLAASSRFRQLHTFDGSNGSTPGSGLTLSTGGSFYGVAYSGGGSNNGLLFRISPSGSYIVLHQFAGGFDGTGPLAPPVQATDGDFYGATYGDSSTPSTIYKYVPTLDLFTTIYHFDSAHGAGVIAPLIQATDGSLYGTAYEGGANNFGTIFKLSTAGILLWSYSFPGYPTGGANPVAPLLQAGDGNFYGTTQLGGDHPGFGIVFRLDLSGNVRVLHSFQGPLQNPEDGSNPFAGLLQATDGVLYGTTTAGGIFNQGALFQISVDGQYKQLFSFNQKGSRIPAGTLAQHTSGLIYGTAESGGKYGFGTVFSLDMGLGPFAALVSYTGKVGGTAEILSQGLTGTTAVTFNGVPATRFTVVSDTYIAAVVPGGATTGPVVVTTPSGKLTSNKNFVKQ
jgi:uncharacterized repeat protein (TIGR03803 family)